MNYMEIFSKEKWDKYPAFHYVMEEDLEKKYNLIGMNKSEAVSLLGEPIIKDNLMCYYDSYIATKEKYYCLEFDEEGIIQKTDLYISSVINKG